MHDIESEADVKKLVDSFYRKVIVDPVIGFIFTEVVTITWEEHMPVMYAFWSTTLLGSSVYTGNPMLKHLELDKKIKLRKEHFDRWLLLWDETVTANFEGKIAAEAIQRARNIASLMQHKINQQRAIKHS